MEANESGHHLEMDELMTVGIASESYAQTERPNATQLPIIYSEAEATLCALLCSLGTETTV